MEKLKISFNAHEAWIEPRPAPNLEVLIKQELTYEDKSASYFNYARRWGNQPAKPTHICLYNHESCAFPTGLLLRVISLLKQSREHIHIEINNLIKLDSNDGADWVQLASQLPSDAYEHQREFVREMFKCRRGIISSPTGSGKTRTAAYFLKLLAPDTHSIISVPSATLLEQTASALEEILGESIGKVGYGKKNWKRITVGIINSLSNLAKENPDSPQLKQCSVWIIDECHEGASPRYQTLSKALTDTNYRIGLSATPKRQQGDDLVLEGILSRKIAEVKETELVNLNVIMQPVCFAIPIPDPNIQYKYYFKDSNGIGHYRTPNGLPKDSDVYDQALIHNKYRNDIIIEICEGFIKSSKRTGPALILVDKVEHGFFLQSHLNKTLDCTVPYLHGETSKEEREKYLKSLQDDVTPLAIASRVLNQGQDIPNLDTLILAGGGAGGNRVVQQIGRAVRTNKAKPKRNPIIIDFADEEVYYLRRHFNKRREAIEKRYENSYRIVSVNDLLEII